VTATGTRAAGGFEASVTRAKPWHRGRIPTTVVVCGDAAQMSRIERPPGVPVTWIAELPELERTAAAAAATDGLAVVIEPAWLESRQTLHDALTSARDAHADVVSGAVRDAALRDPRYAAAAGLRVVLVGAFAAGRGARRPAPAGWPCRNPAWGLWEVRATEAPPRAGLWGRLFGQGGRTSDRRGGLVVLDASTASAAVLQRGLEWAARGVAAGTAVAGTLADLGTILESSHGMPGRMPGGRADDGEDRGSVLRAA
jgi:hypothetical protein